MKYLNNRQISIPKMLSTSLFSRIITSFKNFFATNDSQQEEDMIIKHSTHLEDLVFTRLHQGVLDALDGIDLITDEINNKKPLNISTKIDGCLDKDTLVVTTHGLKKISELTNADFVKCYDYQNDTVIWCSNTIPRNTGKTKSWVEITLNSGHKIKATSDHPFLNFKNEYIEAQYLESCVLKCLNKSDKAMYVEKVEQIPRKHDQWDLTTRTHNFVISTGGFEIVAHNSPAIFMINGDKGFGIATKSIFNKTPKINYTHEDIHNNHKEELADILDICLDNLSKVMPDETNTIYQADVLFTKQTLQTIYFNNQYAYGAQPNTILYTFEKYKDLGRKAPKANIGLAVHTKYKWNGSDPTTIDAEELGCKRDQFKQNDDVFLIDTNELLNRTSVSISVSDLRKMKVLKKQIIETSNNVNWDVIIDPEVRELLMQFFNRYIRNGVKFPNIDQQAIEFKEYIESIKLDQLSQRKTNKGKQSVKEKFEKYQTLDYDQLKLIFEIYRDIIECKMMLIQRLDRLSSIKKYVVRVDRTMMRVGEEGFVLTASNAKGCKLVDRYQFSKNNFSTEIIHGNQHRENQ